MEIPKKSVIIFWHNWWKDKPIWQKTTFKDEEPNHETSSPEMVKPEAVQAPEPVIYHQEKEVSLDDDNDDDFLPETETPAALAPSEPVIFHEEKEISLDDDDDEPQYEEEKLQVNIYLSFFDREA